MEVEPVLHMKGGFGETSYANNSLLQRKVIAQVSPILEETVMDVYCKLLPDRLEVADLGCGSGPNTLIVASQIMETVSAACRSLNNKSPTFRIFLNDLAGNDFNSIFKLSHSFLERTKKEKGDKIGPCFIAAMPGSFYSRLFPTNSLHFVHSSYSLHFLSQAPVSKTGEAILNKGNIYIPKSNGAEAHAAYLQQFEKDFSFFLSLRAQEIVPGGAMLITMVGSHKSDDSLSIMEPLSLAFQDMVSEGMIEQKKLDSFNMPYFTPSAIEAVRVIEAEGSFKLRRLESFEMPWDADISEGLDVCKSVDFIANYMRAIAEPIFSEQFGEMLMDDLFCRFKEKVFSFIKTDKCEYVNLVIYLTKV